MGNTRLWAAVLVSLAAAGVASGAEVTDLTRFRVERRVVALANGHGSTTIDVLVPLPDPEDGAEGGGAASVNPVAGSQFEQWYRNAAWTLGRQGWNGAGAGGGGTGGSGSGGVPGANAFLGTLFVPAGSGSGGTQGSGAGATSGSTFSGGGNGGGSTGPDPASLAVLDETGFDAQEVPEPGAIAMTALGLGFCLRSRLRRGDPVQ